MFKVQDIANFFIYLSTNQVDECFITNLKLNKLLYYAQGCYLARTGKPLFSDAIEAWQYGPVVPDIYKKYRVCGRNPIQSVDDDFNPGIFAGEELEALMDVYREFGKYSGSALVSLTHQKNTPWEKANRNSQTIISNEDIEQFFTENAVSRFSYDLPQITECPSDWYSADEDSIWEAYLP